MFLGTLYLYAVPSNNITLNLSMLSRHWAFRFAFSSLDQMIESGPMSGCPTAPHAPCLISCQQSLDEPIIPIPLSPRLPSDYPSCCTIPLVVPSLLLYHPSCCTIPLAVPSLLLYHPSCCTMIPFPQLTQAHFCYLFLTVKETHGESD